MSPRPLFCIVEGIGERDAVPVLVNRILQHLRRERKLAASPDLVISTKDGERITRPYDPERQIGIEYFVQRAVRDKPAGILVVVDAEERCMQREKAGAPRGLGQELRERAEPIAGTIPLGVVVANRMFESWFLADFHSLRARGYFPKAARLPHWKVPESLGGCKGWIKALLGGPYSETHDQSRLSGVVSLPLKPAMRARSPSLWKLYREVNKLSR